MRRALGMNKKNKKVYVYIKLTASPMNKHQCLMGKIPTTRNMREKKSQTEIFQRFSDWNEDGKLAADFILFFSFLLHILLCFEHSQFN